MFKLMRTLLGIGVVAFCAVAFYPSYYQPLVAHVPELALVLPRPAQAPEVYVQPPLGTPAATAQASASPQPIVLHTPRPSVAPATVPGPAPVQWSASDCSWAVSIMATDAHLDQHEAWLVAEGFDSRYGVSAIAEFEAWEFDWLAAEHDAQSVCAHVVVSAGSIATDRAHFALAIATHQADIVAVPANAVWDRTWIANYQRIDALFAELPS